MDRVRVTVALLLCASVATADDVITMRDGEKIEGLIIEADDDSVLVRWGAGRAVISRRVPRKSISAIKLGEPNVDGLRELARRSESQGEILDAAQVWRIVCALRPESADDHLRCARALRVAGRSEDAAAAIACAARLDADDARIRIEQGEIAFAKGDFRGAVQHAQDGLKRAGPTSVDGYWLLARAAEAAKDADGAIDAYGKLLKADTTHIGALERLVDLLLARRATLEAENVARSFVRAAPDVRAGRVALGVALYRQSRWGEAVDAFRAATSLGGPGYERARVYLHVARARSADTDPDRGLTEADIAVARELDPDLGRKKP
jgi:tetratricopeptide (TPR) repeat protein